MKIFQRLSFSTCSFHSLNIIWTISSDVIRNVTYVKRERLQALHLLQKLWRYSKVVFFHLFVPFFEHHLNDKQWRHFNITYVKRERLQALHLLRKYYEDISKVVIFHLFVPFFEHHLNNKQWRHSQRNIRQKREVTSTSSFTEIMKIFQGCIFPSVRSILWTPFER